MVLKCDTCKNNINRQNPGITCIGKCVSSYHYNCADISQAEKNALLASQNLNWICNTCKDQQKEPTGADVQPTNSDIMKMLMEVRNSIQFCSNKIDDFEAKLNTYSEQIKLIAPLQQECMLLRKQVADLEQRSRSNNVEIVGIPEKNKEDIASILSSIGKTISCPIEKNDIDTYHRVAQFNFNKNKPKNIIVRFISRVMRDKFVASAHKHKNLNTTQINFSESNPVYINDRSFNSY